MTMYTIRPESCESAKFPPACLLLEQLVTARVAMPFQPAIKPRAAIRPRFQRARSCLLAADAPRSRSLFSLLQPPGPPRTDNTVILTTKHGKVTIKLHPDWAPKRVAQIKTLVKEKFYDGLTFHRVIPGFMAQTGDPTGTGGGGSKLPNLPAEFNQNHFKRGVLGMARTDDPNSANSQFFIMFGDGGFLDGKYTAFGEVTAGMDAVDKIKAGTEGNNGAVDNPDKIVTLRMASAR